MTPAQDIYKAAKRHGYVCPRFQGTESPEQLMRLFLTPQGIEFCQKYNFPDIDTLRTFRGLEAARHGIYIDAGRIALRNAEQVALIGDTVAELRYDDPKKRHEVILMHGAKAHVIATGWAVVAVTNNGCEITTETRDRAKIL